MNQWLINEFMPSAPKFFFFFHPMRGNRKREINNSFVFLCETDKCSTTHIQRINTKTHIALHLMMSFFFASTLYLALTISPIYKDLPNTRQHRNIHTRIRVKMHTRQIVYERLYYIISIFLSFWNHSHNSPREVLYNTSIIIIYYILYTISFYFRPSSSSSSSSYLAI